MVRGSTRAIMAGVWGASGQVCTCGTRVLVRPDAQVCRGFGFDVIRRDQRAAGVIIEVRNLRIDQHTDAARAGGRDHRGHDLLGDYALEIVGHDHAGPAITVAVEVLVLTRNGESISY